MKNLFVNIFENIKAGNLKELKKAGYVGLFFILAGLLGNIIFSLVSSERSILDCLRSIKPLYLLLAISLALVPWLTSTFRVMIWTRFLGHRFTFLEMFKVILSTDLGSAISPTAVGGGYVKTGMLMRKGLSAGAAASLMTLGSVEDGLFFLIAIPASVVISSCWDIPGINKIIERFRSNLTTLALIVLIIIGMNLLYKLWRRMRKISKEKNKVLIGIKRKVSEAIHDFINVYKLIGKTGKSRFAVCLILTAIQWICRYSVLTVILLSFGIKVDPVLFFLFQWVTFSLMTFIPTPGAAAGAEASFYLVYTHLIPRDVIGFITASWRFMTFYFQIILSVTLLGVFLTASLWSKSN